MFHMEKINLDEKYTFIILHVISDIFVTTLKDLIIFVINDISA